MKADDAHELPGVDIPLDLLEEINEPDNDGIDESQFNGSTKYIVYRLHTTDKRIRAMSKLLVKLWTHMTRNPACPAPGECLKIARHMELVESRIRKLEDERNIQKGALVVIGSVVGTVAGGIAAWLTNVLRGH